MTTPKPAHRPAGSPDGGQFTSKSRTVVVHTEDLDAQQPEVSIDPDLLAIEGIDDDEIVSMISKAEGTLRVNLREQYKLDPERYELQDWTLSTTRTDLPIVSNGHISIDGQRFRISADTRGRYVLVSSRKRLGFRSVVVRDPEALRNELS